ncbi:MAG: hypothetical protein IMZ69_08360 [Spirochaetes bacterium]|nr:hypothetical protein [Spirochaetota bacterium]
MTSEHTIVRAGQGASDLLDEGAVWMWGGSQEMYAPRHPFDHEQRVVRDEPADGPHLRGKERRTRVTVERGTPRAMLICHVVARVWRS